GWAPASHPDRAPDCWLALVARPCARAVAFRNRDFAGDGAESARRLSRTPTRPSTSWGCACPDRAGRNRGVGGRGGGAHLHRSIAIVDPACSRRLAVDSRSYRRFHRALPRIAKHLASGRPNCRRRWEPRSEERRVGKECRTRVVAYEGE